MFLLKESTGEVHIHEMKNDGTVGREIKRLNWPSGWTSAEFYGVGNYIHLFLLNESTGKVKIYKMALDGSVDLKVNEYDWSSGWTNASFFFVGNETYLFLLKQNNGDVSINYMNLSYLLRKNSNVDSKRSPVDHVEDRLYRIDISVISEDNVNKTATIEVKIS